MTLLLDPETPVARELIYRTIVETADEGIWVTNVDGRTTFVNEKMAGMLGYAVEEMLGRCIADFLLDEDSRTLFQANDNGPLLGLPDHLDLRLQRKDGAEIWALLRRSSIFGADGTFEGSLSMVTDISGRKQAEMLSEALNSVNTDMNSSLDAAAIMQEVLAAAAAALHSETASIMLRERRDWVVRYAQGFSPNIVGMRLTDARLPHAMLAVKERDVIVVEDALADSRIPSPGAEAYGLRSFLILPLIVRNEAIGVAFFNFHSAPQAFSKAQIDFARKLGASLGLALENARLYAAEQRQRALFESVVDNAPAGMVVFSGPELTARLANRSYLSFLAPTWQERGIIGRGLEEFAPGIASDRLAERIHRVARTGRPDMEHEWSQDSAEGTTYWRWTLTPLPGETGGPADVMFQMVDVSEQVRSRQQIEQLLSDLRRANEQLQQQAEELAAQGEELQLQNEQLSEFASQLTNERGRLEAVLQQLPEAVIIAEAPSGKVVLSNHRVEDLLRGPYMHVESPDGYNQYQVCYPDGRPYPPEAAALARAIRFGETVTDEELHLVRGDGTRAVVLVSARPVRGTDDRIVAAVVTFIDITERKRMEESLAQSAAELSAAAAELERRVDERTASLRRATEELAQSNAALHDYARRTEMLAEVSQALAEAGPDTRAVLDTVARRAAEALGDVCAITQLSANGERLVPVAIYHRDPEIVAIFHRFYAMQPGRATEGLSGQVLRSGEPALVPIVNQDDLLAAAQPEVRPFLARHSIYSLLIVPLRARGRNIGTLALGRDTAGRPYTAEEQAFLQALASRAALAIADAELYEKLAAREQQLAYQAHLLENVTDAVYAIDSEFHITAWNHAAEEMFGVPAKDALGRLLPDVLKGAFVEPNEQQVGQMVAATGRYRGLIRYDRSDGTSLLTETTGVVLRDEAGAITGYIGVNRDITEQRQAQEALRHNEALLRKVLETMPVGVLVANRAGRVIADNPAARRIWVGAPYGGEQSAGYRGWWTATGEPIEPYEWGLARAIRGETAIGAEIEIENADGDRRTVLESAVPLLDADGQIIGGLVIDDDITERKRSERALQTQTERLEFMHDIDRAVLAAQSPAEITQGVVERVRRLVQCEQSGVLLFDFERQEATRTAFDAAGQTAENRGQRLTLEDCGVTGPQGADQVRVCDDLFALANPSPLQQTLRNEGLRSFMAIPLLVKDQLIGHLNLMARRAFAFTDTDVEIARQVGASLAVALQNAQLFAQIERERKQQQALARRLVEVQESERRIIARELHDEAGQALTSLIVGLGLLQREAADPQAVIERAAELKHILNSVMEGLHGLSANLRPASLDRMGLVAALRQHVASFRQQSGLDVTLVTLGLEDDSRAENAARAALRLAPDVEIALYRIVQEALTNVARHAQARHVGVVLERRGDRGIAIIEDDGVGFDLNEALARGRLGVFGMSERAEMLGGQLHVESAPGKGTTILVDVPCGTL